MNRVSRIVEDYKSRWLPYSWRWRILIGVALSPLVVGTILALITLTIGIFLTAVLIGSLMALISLPKNIFKFWAGDPEEEGSK